VATNLVRAGLGFRGRVGLGLNPKTPLGKI